MIKETIGFIGCGNMGGAILEGILKNKIARSAQISVYDPMSAQFSHLRKTGVKILKSNAEVIQNSKILILAIKPQEIRNLAAETRGLFKKKTIVSILAGTPVAKVRALLGSDNGIVRAMPNLGAKAGESLTAICGSKLALKKAQIIFNGCGKTVVVRENLIDLVTAVSGSGPAYFFYLMELLAGFAERNGFSKKSANLLAVQTALGAAKLASCSKELPADLRARVTSKGGTTAAALSVLEEKGMRKIFESALKSAQKRAKELSRT